MALRELRRQMGERFPREVRKWGQPAPPGDTDNRMMCWDWSHLAKLDKVAAESCFQGCSEGQDSAPALPFLNFLGSHSLCHWPNLIPKPANTLEKRGEGMDWREPGALLIRGQPFSS